MIPATCLWDKLQSLAEYSKHALAAEIRRLAHLTPGSLKKELESKIYAPINRIPDNLLSDIFLLGLQDDHEDDEHFEFPQRHQGLISRVCYHWKSVIEHTPLAWANITVLDRQPFTTTKRFLTFSRKCLINVTIGWGGSPSYGDNAYNIDEMDHLFTLLLPEAYRWQSLYIAVVEYSLMFHIVQRLQLVAAPNLSLLVLGNCRVKRADDVFTPVRFLPKHKLFQSSPGAPVLRDVDLYAVHVDWSSSFLSSSLRSLTLSAHAFDVRPEPQRFFDILAGCSESLEAFILDDSGPALRHDEDWGPYVSQKIELPKLRTLKVALVPPRHALGIFNMIVARNVTELTLNFEIWTTEAEWNGLIKQLCTGSDNSMEPMFPALLSLRLLSLPAEPMYLGTLLFYYPTITYLVVNFKYGYDALLDTLGNPIHKSALPPSELPGWATAFHSRVMQYQGKHMEGDQMTEESVRHALWVCPKLQWLKVYGFRGKQMRLLVAGRKEGGVPLKEVWYAHTCSVNVPDRAWLKATLEVFREFTDDTHEDDGGFTDDGSYYGDD